MTNSTGGGISFRRTQRGRPRCCRRASEEPGRRLPGWDFLADLAADFICGVPPGAGGKGLDVPLLVDEMLLDHGVEPDDGLPGGRRFVGRVAGEGAHGDVGALERPQHRGALAVEVAD